VIVPLAAGETTDLRRLRDGRLTVQEVKGSRMKTIVDTKIAPEIPGYSYGTSDVAKSPISVAEFEQLKQSVEFSTSDERYLRMAGEVLAGQTRALVETWRGVIAQRPHLARHSRDLEGKPIPSYSEASGLRFEQWILDTCFRTYDEDWLNYQQEIALRHTSLKKNDTDDVQSTPFVPLRDVIAFTAVMNETVKPFLAAKKHSSEEVEKMHSAWCKSLQLQIALWSQPYSSSTLAPDEW